MKYSRITSEAGFSLIEIMLALAVVAIGLIAVVGLIPRGVQASRDAADSTLAATIAHDTFNDLRRQALTTWPPITGTEDICYDEDGTNQVLNCTTSADRYFHVHLVAQSPSAVLLTVAATITWSAKSAVPVNTNFFFTQIANYQQ